MAPADGDALAFVPLAPHDTVCLLRSSASAWEGTLDGRSDALILPSLALSLPLSLTLPRRTPQDGVAVEMGDMDASDVRLP